MILLLHVVMDKFPRELLIPVCFKNTHWVLMVILMPFANTTGTIVTINYLKETFDTEKYVLLCQWFSIYFSLAYWEHMNEIPDFNKIIKETSLPGKPFDPNNKLTA